MSEGHSILRIEEKLQRLIKKGQQLQEENRSLNELISGQQAALVAKQKQIQELEEKIALLKIAAAAQQPAGKEGAAKEMRQRIQEYIQEIDRCIAMLSS